MVSSLAVVVAELYRCGPALHVAGCLCARDPLHLFLCVQLNVCVCVCVCVPVYTAYDIRIVAETAAQILYHDTLILC